MSSIIYKQYRTELRTSLARSLRNGINVQQNEDAFDALIPLWTLIHGLRDISNSPNPTKLMLMSYLRESGDLENFIKASRDHHVERNFGEALQGAHQAMLFTSYFDELQSDSLLFLNAYHMNNYRGCMIALRCMLENLYRHLYYKDNHEHFIRVHELGQSEHDLKLNPAGFRTYLEKASYLKILVKLHWNYNISGTSATGFFNLNSVLYSKTSSFVHGSLPSTLNKFSNNMDFLFDANKANEILVLERTIVELCVAFLCSGHLDQFSRFNEGTKRIIFNIFQGAKRSQFRVAIRV